MKLRCVSSKTHGFTEGREYEVLSQETTPSGNINYKMVSEYREARVGTYPLKGALWEFEEVGENGSDVKPDWSKAPEWANYWAVDDTGCAYWYEEQPILSFGDWRSTASSYEFDKLLAEEIVNGKGFNYMDSLHRRPVGVLEFTMTLEKPAERVEINSFLCSDEREEEVSAASILEAGVGHMKDRATTYDAEGGERSMAKTVECFNALTGRDLTETEGWLMMVCLKLARANQGGFRMDSFEDGAAYIALMGECAAHEKSNKED